MTCCVQKLVVRLSDPYGDCEDPSDVDKAINAYTEQYPVVYTAHVSIRLSISTNQFAFVYKYTQVHS